MTAEDLIAKPRWRPEELGQLIPESAHAVSVALPRWQDVVDYEEKKPELLARLAGGYPRFMIHREVIELARRFEKERPCLPFPSLSAAARCVDFIRNQSGQPAEILTAAPAQPGPDGLRGVATTLEGEAALRAFWRHTGLIVSTRQAAAALAGENPQADDAEKRQSLRRQLAGFYDCAETDVFLAPTGMAAMFTALRALLRRAPGLACVQLGFPYVDTLKLQQKLGHGGILLHRLEDTPRSLPQLLAEQRLAGCFCEIPGNPMLGTPPLQRLVPTLRAHRVPLVADDVASTHINSDLRPFADLIMTSLTKFIVGTCDVMGGALICNPRSPQHAELKAAVQAEHEELLWGEDAEILDRQARRFPERMSLHNANGLLIAERLRRHPAVERVWYPKWETAEAYEAVRRPAGGYGALLSFLPRNASATAPGIYDRLRVTKGPSLGTIFTLACPFTLLAHYDELEWAESCGVPRWLIRLSVGLEDPEELWGKLDAALTV